MRPDHWPRTLRMASAKLHDVMITNEDFATSIAQAPDGALLFVDPPYFNAAQDKFYIPSFPADSHVRLADTLRQHASRLSFLLTYDDCAEVRALYDWATSAEANAWTYCLSHEPDKSRKGKRSKGKEVFIRNYAVCSEAIFAMASTR
jgi:DNA adenine methylase